VLEGIRFLIADRRSLIACYSMPPIVQWMAVWASSAEPAARASLVEQWPQPSAARRYFHSWSSE